MEFLEIVCLFIGWNRQFLECTSDDIFVSGDHNDRDIVYRNIIHYYSEITFWRSGQRMAVTCMHYYLCWWNSAFLYGNYGAVYVEDIYGSKEKTSLYYTGE